VHQERAVGAVEDRGALDGVHRGGDRRRVRLAAGVDGDVAQRVRVVGRDQIDGADRAAALVATRPSIPGRCAIRTRRTTENCADVELMGGGVGGGRRD
jgi:hypothetical protein